MNISFDIITQIPKFFNEIIEIVNESKDKRKKQAIEFL